MKTICVMLAIALIVCTFTACTSDNSLVSSNGKIPQYDSIPEKILTAEFNSENFPTDLYAYNNSIMFIRTGNGSFYSYDVTVGNLSKIFLPDEGSISEAIYDSINEQFYLLSSNSNIYNFECSNYSFIEISTENEAFFKLTADEVPEDYKDSVENVIRGNMSFSDIALWNNQLVVSETECYSWEFLHYNKWGWKDTVDGEIIWVWADTSQWSSKIATETFCYNKVWLYENDEWKPLDSANIFEGAWGNQRIETGDLTVIDNRLFMFDRNYINIDNRIEDFFYLWEWTGTCWEKNELSFENGDDYTARFGNFNYFDGYWYASTSNDVLKSIDFRHWISVRNYYAFDGTIYDAEESIDGYVKLRYLDPMDVPLYTLNGNELAYGFYRYNKSENVWHSFFEDEIYEKGNEVHRLHLIMGYDFFSFPGAIAVLNDTLYVSMGLSVSLAKSDKEYIKGLWKLDLTKFDWYNNLE